MASFDRRWNVLPHGGIEKLEPNLWRVEGTLPGGMALRRVMTIARRADGGVLVHSAIALEEELMREIESLGPIHFLVIPGRYHRLDARVFKDRYPSAKVVCPRAAERAVADVVPVDLTYDGFPADGDVTMRHLAGTGDREGVLIVRHGDRTSVVVNDTIFNMPHQPGFMGFVVAHVLRSSGGPRISSVARLLMIKDLKAFRRDLLELSNLPGLARIVVSHHEVIDENARDVLAELSGSDVCTRPTAPG